MIQNVDSVHSIKDNINSLKNNLNEFSQKNEIIQENILNDLVRINGETSKYQEMIGKGVDFQSSVNNQLEKLQEQFTNI